MVNNNQLDCNKQTLLIDMVKDPLLGLELNRWKLIWQNK